MSSLSVIYIHRQHRHQHHYGQYPIERDRGIVDETEDGQKRRRRLNHVRDNITSHHYRHRHHYRHYRHYQYRHIIISCHVREYCQLPPRS